MSKLIISALALVAGTAFSYGNMKNKEGFQQTRVLSNEVSGSSEQVTGTVVKTINAASYTYIKLKDKNGEFWAAATAVKLDKGQRVILDKIFPMDNFHSKTLDRTFKKILFVQNVAVLNKK